MTLRKPLNRTLTSRVVSMMLSGAMAVISVPAPAQATTPDAPPHVRSKAPKIEVNRKAPAVRPVPLHARFSAQPTDQELFRARVFEEPLVPAGGETSSEENRALAEAIQAYQKGTRSDALQPFEAFLARHHSSAWRASLLMNMGLVRWNAGRFSRAASAWQEAWDLARDLQDPQGRAIADRAVSELMYLLMRFSRISELQELIDDTTERPVRGPASVKAALARQGLWTLLNLRQDLRSSAAAVIDRYLSRTRADYGGSPLLARYRASRNDTALTQVRDLAESVGLKLRMEYREPQAEIVVPALVHMKLDRIAALVAKDEKLGKYLLDDPALEDEIWIDEDALRGEMSGYVLTEGADLEQGSRAVDAIEGGIVLAGCIPRPQPDWGGTCNNERVCPKEPPCSGGGPGMPTYSFHSLLASLSIDDTPLFYAPPRGPSFSVEVTYNLYEVSHPQIFSYSNLGTGWVSNFISYVADDPSDPLAQAELHMSGGGMETHTIYGDSSFVPHRDSHTALIRTSLAPIRYELRRPDGSMDVYGQPDSDMASPRRVFLTERIDPQGEKLTYAYDDQIRLSSITDADGQVSTFSYENVTDPLKITAVTDPFGRNARFEYNGEGALTAITDMIGLRTEFTYDGASILSSMITPYGTTTFRSQISDEQRMVEATDPLGGTRRLEYQFYLPVDQMPATEAQVTEGMEDLNTELNWINTFYWDERAMALHPGEYDKAKIIHWLYDPGKGSFTGIKHSEKMPLENRVWYAYTGTRTTGLGVVGMGPVFTAGLMSQPYMIGRVLDDGSSQIQRYEYNQWGNVIREADPLGRSKIYVYADNGVDLLEVQQVRGATTERLSKSTYNDKHQILATTDAAGNTTRYAYDVQGRLASVTTPATQAAPDGITNTYEYYSDGKLKATNGPVPGMASSYTYYPDGKIETVTSSAQGEDDYTVTYEYDGLGRITKLLYPDGTYEETVYDKLDAVKHRDRVGRWTTTGYDALRREVLIRDPAGRTIHKEWGRCGSGGCGFAGDKLTRLVDPNGNETRWEHDLQGRVIREIRADDTFTEYTYENTTSRLKQIKDRKGTIATFDYALDDRLLKKSFSDDTPDYDYAYDPVTGRLLTAANGTDTLTWTYDTDGRLLTEQSAKNASTVSYTYDSLGNRETVSLDGALHATYAYDAYGRLDSIMHNSQTFGFTYDSLFRRATMTYPNGVVTTYDYDRESRLLDVTAAKDAATIAQHTYTYNTIGNRLTKTTPEYAETYDYDAADQLISATRTGAGANHWRWTYDPAGNRTTEQIGDAVTGATHNNMNQLLSRQPGGALQFKGTVSEPATVAIQGQPAQVDATNVFTGAAQVPEGTSTVDVQAEDASGNVRTSTYQVSTAGETATYTYDDNGNLQTKAENGHLWAYEWNALNQLVRVTKDAAEVATFEYDPRGRRIEKIASGVTTSFTYDEEDILRETNGVTTNTYIHGSGIDEPLRRENGGVITYYHADGLGSIVDTTGTTGTEIETWRYDAWGNLEIGANQPGYAFTGREWDPESELYYYRARYYDPKTGEFISEDRWNQLSRLREFVYADNNPIQVLDPTGQYIIYGSDLERQKLESAMKKLRDELAKAEESTYCCSGYFANHNNTNLWQWITPGGLPRIRAIDARSQSWIGGAPDLVTFSWVWINNKNHNMFRMTDCKLAGVILHEMLHLARKDTTDNEEDEGFKSCKFGCIDPRGD